MRKFDTLSPSFFAGFIGYVLTGTGWGFVLAAALVWFGLTALLVIAVLGASRQRVEGDAVRSELKLAR